MNLPEFLVSTVLLAVTPGVCQIMLLRQVVLDGRRGGLIALAGSVLAFLVWVLAAAGGLTAVLGAMPGAMTAVTWAGGLFLIVLGTRSMLTLRHPADGTAAALTAGGNGRHEALGVDGGVAEFRTAPVLVGAMSGSAGGSALAGPAGGEGPGFVGETPVGRWRAGDIADLRTGLFTNLANPQVGVFMLAFLPQFVPPGGDAFTWMTGLGLLWTAIVGAVLVGLVLAVSAGAAFLDGPRVRTGLGAVSGLVLIVLGVGTLLS